MREEERETQRERDRETERERERESWPKEKAETQKLPVPGAVQ